jgi:hypothetical protein
MALLQKPLYNAAKLYAATAHTINDLKGPHERRMPHLQKIRGMDGVQSFKTILFRTLQAD